MLDRFFFFSSSFCFGIFLQVRFPWFTEQFWYLLGFLLAIFIWRGFKRDFLSFLLLCLMLIAGGYVRIAGVKQSGLKNPPDFQDNERYLLQLQSHKNNNLQLEVLPLLPGGFSFLVFSNQKTPITLEEGAVFSGILRNIQKSPVPSGWSLKAEITGLQPATDTELHFAARLHAFLNTIRIWLRKKLENMFSYYPRLHIFLQTALLQQHTEESRNMAENLRLLGLLHVFCVSGLHVSILSLVFMTLFGLLRIPAGLRSSLVGLIILFYGIITGFSPSVLRAVSCGLITLAGLSLNRNIRTLRILCLVLLIHAAVFPLDCLQPGFHLTYGLCLILLRWGHLATPRKFLFLGLIIQVYLLPYALYAFGKYPLFSFFGLFLTPILSILLIYGFLSLGIGIFFISPVLFFNRLFGNLGEGFLFLLTEGSEKLQFFWENTTLSLPAVCGIYALFSLPLLHPGTGKKKNRELIDKFESYCRKLEPHDSIGSGLELLRFLEMETEKEPDTENEAPLNTEILLHFTELWKQNGHNDYLPFIRFGIMSEYIVLKIRAEIFLPLQQKIKNERLVFDLSAITNPAVRLFLSGQKSFHDLSTTRQILNFFSLHINSGLTESLSEPRDKMEIFWRKVFLILNKTAWFEPQNFSHRTNRNDCYAKFSEIRELLSGLSLA